MKGWKTIAFSVIIAGLGAVQEVDLVSLVGDQNAGLVMISIGAIVAGLRLLTTTPVGKSE